jgi:glycosyltransferase involved in cell wall biosynthesis
VEAATVPATEPSVTIGVPAYNAARFIGDTLASALCQTYPRIEIVVYDDCSTDETVDVVRSVGDDRVRLVVNAEHLGLVGNHNRILDEARGDYVKLLHADDVLAPGAVERQVRAMADPRVALVTSRRAIIDEEGRRLMARGPRWREAVVSRADLERELVRAGRNLLGEPSALLVRLDAVRAAGGYDESWPAVLDLEFALRVLGQGELYFIPDELVSFRVSRDQASRSVDDVQVAQLRRLLMRVQADSEGAISDSDLRRGLVRVGRQAVLRRAFYRAVGTSVGHRALALLGGRMGGRASRSRQESR